MLSQDKTIQTQGQKHSNKLKREEVRFVLLQSCERLKEAHINTKPCKHNQPISFIQSGCTKMLQHPLSKEAPCFPEWR